MSIVQQFPNPGVYVVENDTSLFSRTRYSGVIYLVVGSSKKGPHNAPVLCENVNQFEQTYGQIDYKLERKSSYFHRTCEKLLETGPVYCLSLLPTNSEIDKITWKSFSCATHLLNGPTIASPYADMFDRTGFWRRSTEQLLFIADKYTANPEDNILHVVNYGNAPLTIFIIKSELSGLNVTFEDWFGSNNVPLYLHPKDWANDYVVRFIAVYGDFTDYQSLSIDDNWGQYFNNTGLIKENVSAFVNNTNTNIIADYTVSLIPYFKDEYNRDLYIETIVNKYTAKTGIFVAFDVERFETDYRSGLVDLIGQNLIQETNFVLNYLSYEEVVADTIIIPESKLDLVDNSWGDPNWSLGRTNLMAEGYVHNAYMKPLILSQTTSYLVKPLRTSSDSYAILKGTKIDISTEPEFILELEILSLPGTHFALAVILTVDGIIFRTGKTSNSNGTLNLPNVDVNNEIVLAYYIINQTSNGSYQTTLRSVTLTEEYKTPGNSFLPGWVPVFSNSAAYSVDIETREPVNKITFDTYTNQPTNQLIMRFQGANKSVVGDYNRNRVVYMYSYLKSNLKVGESVLLDHISDISPGGSKRNISTIQYSDDGDDKLILLEVENSASVINNINDLMFAYVSIYFNDEELILQDETRASSTNQPYKTGYGGILGLDSEIYKQYYAGEINTGDRVFQELDYETNVRFKFDNGENQIVFDGHPVESYEGKIFVTGTEWNDGIYTILNTKYDDVNDIFTLVVLDDVNEEIIHELTFYDANEEYYFEFSFIGNDLAVQYKSANLGNDELYKKSSTTIDDSYRRTLEIERILDPNTILVDLQRYSKYILIGGFIRISINADDNIDEREIDRGVGRIIDAYQYDEEGKYMLIKADSEIFIRVLSFVVPNNNSTSGNVRFEQKISELYLGVDNWVLTHKGHFFEGFNVRNDSLPDGTDERLDEIMSLIHPSTGIFKALSNKNNITWRYLVDSYGIGFNQEVKRPLAQLCQEHISLGFLNIPSIKQFINSNKTAYSINGNFNIDLLTRGGIKQQESAPTFNLLNGDESSYIAYFFPNIYVEDIKNRRALSVPPAAWMASAFVINKWQTNRSGIYPWTVVAGMQFGLLTDINNLEFSFTEDDLGKLNQINLNPMTRNSNGQFWIFSNNTAYTATSSLGHIHVREMLIELENQLRLMLINYQWRFNTVQSRREIANSADKICEVFKKNKGLHDYKNIMDETNNTPTLIDNGIGVLDTYIEANQAMGTIVLQVEILNTGQISTSQFLR